MAGIGGEAVNGNYDGGDDDDDDEEEDDMIDGRLLLRPPLRRRENLRKTMSATFPQSVALFLFSRKALARSRGADRAGKEGLLLSPNGSASFT